MHRHLASAVTRRRILQVGATLPAALVAACMTDERTPRPIGSPAATPPSTPTADVTPRPTPPATPSPTPTPAPATGRVLYRNAALADGRTAQLERNLSVLVEEGLIAWIRPADGEEDPGEAEIVDAAGATIVPGMVDCHSHITGPGGANWIARFGDPTDRLLEYAELNGRLAWNAGIRWCRDVGSPRRTDPHDGRERALALGVRDRWSGRRDVPIIRAAGTWITRGALPELTLSVENVDQLVAAAEQQLDEGADLVKIYMEVPGQSASPWSADEVRRVVAAVHERDARITAHGSPLAGIRAAAEAGVDAIEHGFELDAATAQTMAANGVTLVSTLTVLRSFLSFGRTTTMPRFTGDNANVYQQRLEAAEAGVRAARDAGVRIAAGTDFGGGSARANQLAWEVESLVAAGLEPVGALAAATWRGGELLNEPEAGVIREGGPADFFLVHGDPLSDPGALWRVWRHA